MRTTGGSRIGRLRGPVTDDPWNLIRVMLAKGSVSPMSAISVSAEVLSPPGIAVRGARLTHGDRVLFDGLDLRLEAGQWTCLLGPSGVGKTMLLRLVAGLEDRAEGAVACDDGAPAAGRIAYMAQQDLLLPWLSLHENVLRRRRAGRRANRLHGSARGCGGPSTGPAGLGPTPSWPRPDLPRPGICCPLHARAACVSARRSPAP